VLWLTIWFVPIEILALVFGRDSIFVTEAIFFSKAAVVTFGGAYAVLSYIAQQAVEVYQWLAPGEMLDGLGMAETTPGPLIQVVQFVGYMGAFRQPGALSPVAAGALGSLVTAWVTFVPCFLFVLAGAPVAEHLRGRRSLDAALATISAAIVGVILNLTVWFSVHTLFGEAADVMVGPLRLLIPIWESIDPATLILAIAASVAMLRFRVSMLATLAGTALVGLLYRLVLG
jgi:chromate transporter